MRVRALPLPPVTLTIQVGATGSASVPEVWHRYVTPQRWPQWSPQIQRVEGVEPSRPVTAGTTGRVVGPMGVPIPFRVSAVDPAARRWAWRVRVGGLVLTLDHGVDALDVDPSGLGRTRAWVRIAGPAPMVLAYAPLARVALSRLVRVPDSDVIGQPADVAGPPRSPRSPGRPPRPAAPRVVRPRGADPRNE